MTRTATFAREQLRAPVHAGAARRRPRALRGCVRAAYCRTSPTRSAGASPETPRARLAPAGRRRSSPGRWGSSRRRPRAEPTGGSRWLARGPSAWPYRASARRSRSPWWPPPPASSRCMLRTGVAHPWHAAAAVLAFAVIYLAVGIVIGSVITAPLEGSLAVAFVFLLDVFSGPGMAEQAAPYSVSRKAADILIAAGLGQRSSDRGLAQARRRRRGRAGARVRRLHLDSEEQDVSRVAVATGSASASRRAARCSSYCSSRCPSSSSLAQSRRRRSCRAGSGCPAAARS